MIVYRDQVLLAPRTSFRGKVFCKRGNRIGVVPWNDEAESKFNRMQMQLDRLVIEELWMYANAQPTTGSAMVAFDRRTSKYMRATVISVQLSRSHVYFIDTGETVVVLNSSLYPLCITHTTIYEVLPMAFDCLIVPADNAAGDADSAASTSAGLSPAPYADHTMIEYCAIVRVTTVATAESGYPPLNVRVRLETSTHA